MIELKNVSKIYYQNGVVSTGFTKANIKFEIGEFVAIVGESGSGKSTLLNVLSGVDTYEEGEMYINGEETSHYTKSDYEEYRRNYVANIFQSFNLVNSYTVRQNVELVLELKGYSRKEIKEKSEDFIKKVNLWNYRNSRVSKLSGGQKQRVAIARALAKDTPIIVADEPTGNLDEEAASQIVKLLKEVSKEKLVIVVTHNINQIKDECSRIIKMHDGKILEDKKLRDFEKFQAEKSFYKPMKISSKMIIALRNIFNLPVKFMLLFGILAFMSLIIFQQYTNYESNVESLYAEITSNIFKKSDTKRILVKKTNKDTISEEDIANIKKIKNVVAVDTCDLMSDFTYTITNFEDSIYDWLYISGNVEKISDYKGTLAYGQMPTLDNEVIVVGPEGSSLEDSQTYLNKNASSSIGNKTIKVVITGSETTQRDDYTIYVSQNLYNEISRDVKASYVTMKSTLNNKGISAEIITSSKIKEGEAAIYEIYNSFFTNDTPLNKELVVNSSSIYFEKTTKLKITKLYKENEYKSLIDDINNDGTVKYIIINPNDYEKIIDNGLYQISVYANKEKNVDKIVEKLKEENYTTLAEIDTVNKNSLQIKLLKLLYKFILLCMLLVMFFVTYLVVTIILKSTNKYYVTIRTLGATKKISKQLLKLEMLFNGLLSYTVILIIFVLLQKNIISINKTIDNWATYLNLKICIYALVTNIVLVQLIASKYVKKVFKKSINSAFNEEV